VPAYLAAFGEAQRYERVSRVRRDLADNWLRRTDFNVKHRSYLLGYSEAAAFSRAYKRWTGRSPGWATA